MKKFILFLLILSFAVRMKAQSLNCTFKPPQITIDFGAGDITDLNADYLRNYDRVGTFCPTDGHYTYTPYTSDCFRGDWFTLIQDHTTGDESGNMLLVNSSYNTGAFFSTTINGLKAGTTYQFGVWLMNVCRITEKCPFPLLPDLTIMIQTPEGKNIAIFSTGEITRNPAPHWTEHRAVFTTPPAATQLLLLMVNNNPGGCGNDFVLDDITLRECKKTPPKPTAAKKPKGITNKPAATEKTAAPEKSTPPQKAVTKKPAPASAKKPVTTAVKTPKPATSVPKTGKDPVVGPGIIQPGPPKLPPAPQALTTRENALVKQIETEAGDISIRLYDNGEIDDDTVSIYHNNVLLKSHVRLSQKPITINIPIDSTQPHHELVMVAENLGSIPPNTSLMIVTVGNKRYEIFISSSEQKNAKVIFDLRN